MEMSNPTVGTVVYPGQTDIRITTKASNREAANDLIAPVEREIRARLGEYIFGVDHDTLAGTVLALLAEESQTLAVAETATQAGIANALLAEEGHGESFVGGCSARSSQALAALLGAEGAVASAEALADLTRRRHGAGLGLVALDGLGDMPEEQKQVQFALAWDGGSVSAAPTAWRSGPAAQGWLVHTALDLVRRHLAGLPVVHSERVGSQR
jgi:nicotinamide-nucleotide amidase